jgi:hypothetical protein
MHIPHGLAIRVSPALFVRTTYILLPRRSLVRLALKMASISAWIELHDRLCFGHIMRTYAFSPNLFFPVPMTVLLLTMAAPSCAVRRPSRSAWLSARRAA